ncbi:hypothetical protein [Nocardia alni]|uniref:hypothetical protein n=1 Tax=Nocardia alni TaxID=2815723 RepID=UPI001C22594B|nr:hypothetical protein [Nocardia alni]
MEPDSNDRPGDRADIESALRRDFARAYRLGVAAEFATTQTEGLRLREQADHIARSWLAGNDEWTRHWQYLDDACDHFRDDPIQARKYPGSLTHHDSPDPATAATKLASLQQAWVMDHERRIATAPPDPIDHRTLQTLPYTATYRPHGRLKSHERLTSWWQAREWIRDTTYRYPSTAADIEISARDIHTGTQHVLMTAEHADPIKLRTELTRLDQLLGARRNLDGKPWLDELCADVLADEYHKVLAAQSNPWGMRHRFEHQLRADDLRDQYLDFATRAAIPSPADLLASIDHTVRTTNLYAIEPATTSWLDDTVTHAEQAPVAVKDAGLSTHYRAPDDSAVTIVAGWNIIHGDTPWYAETRIAVENNGWISTHTGPSGHYATCAELMAALQQHAGTGATDPGSARAVPANVAATLWDFEGQLADLTDDLTATQHIRQTIRSDEPYRLTSSGSVESQADGRKQLNSTALEQDHSHLQGESKLIDQNRERAKHRRQRANRQPPFRPPPHRRRP